MSLDPLDIALEGVWLRNPHGLALLGLYEVESDPWENVTAVILPLVYSGQIYAYSPLASIAEVGQQTQVAELGVSAVSDSTDYIATDSPTAVTAVAGAVDTTAAVLAGVGSAQPTPKVASAHSVSIDTLDSQIIPVTGSGEVE